MVANRFTAVDGLIRIVQRYVDVVVDLLLPIVRAGFTGCAPITVWSWKNLFQLTEFVILSVLFIRKRLPCGRVHRHAKKQSKYKANPNTKSHCNSLA